MDFTSLALFGGTLFTLAIIPGPAVFAIITRSMSFGKKGSLLFCLGLLCGDLLWFSMAALGLAAIATNFEGAFIALRWFGAAYLAYIAYGIWKSSSNADVGQLENDQLPSASAFASLLSGMLFNLSNPKAIIFYLALMPNLVRMDDLTALGFLELALVLSTVLLSINGTYSFLAVKLRGVLSSQKALHSLNRLACIGLIGIATLMIAR
ncbi:LysE family translocator [Pseudovibrio sp. Tun.PSC04-5.I4]|uniref:LysE family translocator n=1 Tax=Pseudovibrio sp. Tun.PSC04-5.I4 TaxID=1798213 RepID=UPI0008891DA5|nr:LysE family translocator [Pseudovibrio sp. Tun.PSC04-5.I4]SDR25569.1 Threonine/homoserine/homoserine lactone efflux protein [Pseudovibrio sp. Tun.PSC04-5.I4]